MRLKVLQGGKNSTMPQTSIAPENRPKPTRTFFFQKKYVSQPHVFLRAVLFVSGRVDIDMAILEVRFFVDVSDATFQGKFNQKS